MLPLRSGNPPAWIYPGARYDFDFANQRYWGIPISMRSANGANPRMLSLGVEANAGGATNTYFRPDPSGTWRGNEAQFSPPITGYGLWSEGYLVSTNYCLQSRDFTNASWVTATMTSTKNQIGANGAVNAASLITATGNNATILQTISGLSSGTTYSGSVLMKRVSGTGAIYLTMNGSTFTQVDGSINSTRYTQTSLSTSGVTSYTFGIKMATNGDSVAVDFAQFENNSSATSPILTTSASVQRGPEGLYVNNSTVPTANTADNNGYRVLNDIEYGTPATVMVQYSGNFDPTHGHLLWGDALGNTLFIASTGGGGNVIALTTQSGTLTSADSDVSGLLTNTGTGVLNKVIVRVDGGGSAICVNGGQITKSSSVKYTSSTTVPAGMTHGGWLNNGSNGLPTNGYLKRSTFWNKSLTDGEMIQYSTVTNNT